METIEAVNAACVGVAYLGCPGVATKMMYWIFLTFLGFGLPGVMVRYGIKEAWSVSIPAAVVLTLGYALLVAAFAIGNWPY